MATKKGTSKALSTKTAKTQETGLSVAPSYIGRGGVGKEQIRRSDLKIPFLRIGQKTSPEVARKKVPEGSFYNSVSGKVYGKEVRVIVLVYQPKRMRFQKYDDGGGILCQSPDAITAIEAKGEDAKKKPTNVCASCVFSQWTESKTGKKPPLCAEQGAYAVMVVGENQPMTLIFQNTSYPAHRKLATMLAMSDVDIFGNVFKITAKEVTVEKPKPTSFYVLDVEADGFVTEQEYKVAQQIQPGLAKNFGRDALTQATPE